MAACFFLFFLVSALLRDYSLCWDRWRGTWLLHLTQPCYMWFTVTGWQPLALGRVLIWVGRRIVESNASPGWEEGVQCWWNTPKSRKTYKNLYTVTAFLLTQLHYSHHLPHTNPIPNSTPNTLHSFLKKSYQLLLINDCPQKTVANKMDLRQQI